MNLRVTYGDTVTVAELEVEAMGMRWCFTGEAKMHPSDTYDQNIGELYAVSRAFKAASSLFGKIADNKVNDSWRPRNST